MEQTLLRKGGGFLRFALRKVGLNARSAFRYEKMRICKRNSRKAWILAMNLTRRSILSWFCGLCRKNRSVAYWRYVSEIFSNSRKSNQETSRYKKVFAKSVFKHFSQGLLEKKSPWREFCLSLPCQRVASGNLLFDNTTPAFAGAGFCAKFTLFAWIFGFWAVKIQGLSLNLANFR